MVSLLPPGLTKTIVWKRLSSEDQFGDPTYISQNIDVLWMDKKTRIRKNGHDDIICKAFFYTGEAVQENDAIEKDGITWPVVDVKTGEGYMGVCLRKVSLGG